MIVKRFKYFSEEEDNTTKRLGQAAAIAGGTTIASIPTLAGISKLKGSSDSFVDEMEGAIKAQFLSGKEVKERIDIETSRRLSDYFKKHPDATKEELEGVKKNLEAEVKKLVKGVRIPRNLGMVAAGLGTIYAGKKVYDNLKSKD